MELYLARCDESSNKPMIREYHASRSPKDKSKAKHRLVSLHNGSSGRFVQQFSRYEDHFHGAFSRGGRWSSEASELIRSKSTVQKTARAIGEAECRRVRRIVKCSDLSRRPVYDARINRANGHVRGEGSRKIKWKTESWLRDRGNVAGRGWKKGVKSRERERERSTDLIAPEWTITPLLLRQLIPPTFGYIDIDYLSSFDVLADFLPRPLGFGRSPYRKAGGT